MPVDIGIAIVKLLRIVYIQSNYTLETSSNYYEKGSSERCITECDKHQRESTVECRHKGRG